MKETKKTNILKLSILLVLTLTAPLIAAEESQDAPATAEVRTTLEERIQKRVSLDFVNTPINDVIRIMAKQADVDVIKSPKVIGSVTAKLTDIPLEEALGNILAAHGYGYVKGQNMLRIVPLEERTEQTERLINRIYRITYAEVVEVEKTLRKFISKRGSISSNIGTGNIIVTDTESKIKAIDTFINEIDRITPQILVEVRIYDITTKDRLDLGIEWNAGRNTVYDTTSGVGTGGVNPGSGRTDPFLTGAFAGATSKAATASGALRFGWLNSALDIDVLLKAQQEKICATLLANPRIMVLDNQTAMIKIVEELAFQELTNTSNGGSIGTTEFREVGVELEVTPHVTRDGMIRLKLKPKFSVDTGDVQLSAAAFPQPIIDRREAETTLLIKDGRTVVLGGLRKKDVSKQENKIPLLGDIPLLGALFRFEGEETINSELVVFITPVIIDEPVLSDREANVLAKTEICTPGCDPARLDSCGK